MQTAGTPLKCDKGKVYKSTDGSQAVDGTGWLPLDFTKISGGSPIESLDKDPLNSGQYYYSFACDPGSQKYELDAKFEEVVAKTESSKSFDELLGTDGGNNPGLYEVGSDLNLIP